MKLIRCYDENTKKSSNNCLAARIQSSCEIYNGCNLAWTAFAQDREEAYSRRGGPGVQLSGGFRIKVMSRRLDIISVIRLHRELPHLHLKILSISS
jgi:hypothetical protein